MACQRGTCHGVFFTSLADRAVEHADIRQLDGARLELAAGRYLHPGGIMPPTSLRKDCWDCIGMKCDQSDLSLRDREGLH